MPPTRLLSVNWVERSHSSRDPAERAELWTRVCVALARALSRARRPRKAAAFKAWYLVPRDDGRRAGLSKKDLADRLGVSVRMLNYYLEEVSALVEAELALDGLVPDPAEEAERLRAEEEARREKEATRWEYTVLPLRAPRP